MRFARIQSSIARLAVGAGVAALAIGAQSAHAQAVAPEVSATSGQSDGGIQDIVVTAQRRSESVQRVPISIQVLTNETLARNVVVDTRDLATMSPTVNFTNSASAPISAFGLRGIATTANAPGLQPSTVLVIDGVPVYNQGEFIAGLGDIERVEILNGPQGTLFGKNSTAGVISITTRQPTSTFEGEVEGSQTTDRETVVRGMINLPVSDTVRLRFNGFYRNLSPLIKNLTSKDVFGIETYGVSAKGAIDLSDTATFTLAGSYSHTDASNNQFLLVGPSIYAAQAVGFPVRIGRKQTTVATTTPAKDVYSTANVMGTLNWELSDQFSLTSISNYSHFDDVNELDGDGLLVGSAIGTGFAIPGSTYPLQSLQAGRGRTYDLDYVSQEIRGNFKSGPIDAVFGGFYQNAKLRYTEYTATQTLAAGGGLLTTGNDIHASFRNKTASLFGDVTYALSDMFKVFGGLRYTHETIDMNYQRKEFAGPTASTFDVVSGQYIVGPARTLDIPGARKVNNLSGRAGIQFQPATNVNLYGSFAKGYKGPAANTSTSLSPTQNKTLEPEKATAYEVGAKLRLFDNKVALNGALFHNKIGNLQITAIDQTAPTVTTLLLNAGHIVSKGFEGDLTWAVTPEFRLGGALAYVDATYGGFTIGCNSVQNATGTCPNFGGKVGVQNGDGLPAARSPKWKYSITGNYESELPGSSLKYYLQTSWTWTDSIQYLVDNNPRTRERPHGMLNASIGIKTADDRFEVQIFGKNLTNDFYYASFVNIPVIAQPAGYVTRDFHRYGGIRLLARF